jgi:tRNA pseudouridine38-40 synthase
VAATGTGVEIRAEANAFLHQMVRSLVGTLVAVGEGRVAAHSIGAILAARDRSAARQIAPPHGLILMRVRYRR